MIAVLSSLLSCSHTHLLSGSHYPQKIVCLSLPSVTVSDYAHFFNVVQTKNLLSSYEYTDKSGSVLIKLEDIVSTPNRERCSAKKASCQPVTYANTTKIRRQFSNARPRSRKDNVYDA